MAHESDLIERIKNLRNQIADLTIRGFDHANEQGDDRTGYIHPDEGHTIEKLIQELKSLVLWPSLDERG